MLISRTKILARVDGLVNNNIDSDRKEITSKVINESL